MQANDFSNLSGLTVLWLTDNDIRSVDANLFSGLTALEEVYLGDNRLSTLPDNLLSNLPALKKISVRENNISTLPANLFSNPSRLKEFYLTHNNLSSVNAATFSGLTALEKLALNHNNLQSSSLPAGFFAGLPALKSLWLNSNHFPGLNADFFSNLTGLEELHLADIGLSTLPTNLFFNLSSLESLSLSHNDLSSVSAAAFSGLTSLDHLSMDFADLESSVLPAGVFASLSSLRFLSLRGNRLESLPAGIFSGLTSLTELDVSRNPTDPLPISVSLELVANGRFRAGAHTGAPFEIGLPLQMIHGALDGGAGSIVISAGMLESGAVTVTRTAGTIGAVTVVIESLPEPPATHSGYVLVNYTDAPLEVLPPVPKVIIYPTEITVAASYSNIYRMLLNTQPAANVTVEVNVSSDSDVSVNPTERTFTAVTYGISQMVAVAADSDAVANDVVTLSHTVRGGEYQGLSTEDVTVTIAAVTSTNQPPDFTSAATFDVKENETEVGTVVATDPEAIDYVTNYDVTGGDHQTQFAITDEGILSFLTAPDFERPVATGNEYTVEVTTTSGLDAREQTETQTIRINVIDVDEPPGRPAAPILSVSDISRELSISPNESPPVNKGPDITSWDIQYRIEDNLDFSSHTPSSEPDWMQPNWNVAIPHVIATWVYVVQVRASNEEGDSEWSPSAEATIPNAQPVAIGSIDDVTLPEGGAAKAVSVDGVFSDPDGFRLGASSSNEAVATARMYGNAVTVDPIAAGAATITLTATDPWGLSGSLSFDATIQAPSLQAPSVSIGGSVVTFGFTDAFQASETRAYDVRIRHKSPVGPWAEACISITNPDNIAEDITTSQNITASAFFEPGTTYEADYIYLGSGCESSAVGLPSAAAEVTTTGTPTFDIKVVYPDGAPSSDHVLEIEAAVARWEQIITHDIPNYRLSASEISQFRLDYPGIEVPEVVDDLMIFVRVSPAYGYVSAMHALKMRPSPSSLPWLSEVSFKTVYVVESIVSQRICHALGFHSSVWKRHNLLQHEANPSRPQPQPDTHFSGTKAIDAFDAAGGLGYTRAKVPVENVRNWAFNNAWRVSVFPGSEELMSPYPGPALSAITIQAMADIGYRVDVTQADPYTIPLAGLSKATPALLEGTSPEDPQGLIRLDHVVTQRPPEVGEPAPFVLKMISTPDRE